MMKYGFDTWMSMHTMDPDREFEWRVDPCGHVPFADIGDYIRNNWIIWNL